MNQPISEDSLGSLFSLINIVNPVKKGTFRLVVLFIAIVFSTSIYIYFSDYYGKDDDFVRLVKQWY